MRRPLPLALAVAAVLAAAPARASEFSVSPVRAELRAGALSETITITNLGNTRIRVGVKVMEWKQDAQGNDQYGETADLVYFPRQMELEPQAKRLVRVGARAPAAGTERAYRMFIEEQPDPAAQAQSTHVAVYFRFGVPIFLPPAAARAQPDILEPVLEGGRVLLPVKNSGNQHFRLLRLVVRDGAGFSREISGWYSLAGTQRTYALEVPRDVCRRAKTLSVAIEGDGVSAERVLHVDPARCP